MIFKEKMKLSVVNQLIRASNLVLTDGAVTTQLTTDVSATGTTIVVANWKSLANNDYLLLGNFGEPTAEIVKIGAAPTTTSVTVGALAFDHYADTPITVVPFNLVQFFRYATLVDANTVDITAGQLGSDANIDCSESYTKYSDSTNSTGYAYIRFKNTTTTKYSEFSIGVSYEGNVYNSVEEITNEGCAMVGVEAGSEYAKEQQLMSDANEAQNIILKRQDWSFELVANDTSLTSTENEYKYALSGLTSAMKYPDSKQGIMNVKFGSKILKYIDWQDFEENFEDASVTTLASDAAAAATSITLTDSYEFAESGTCYLGTNTITYTANAEATGVLSGIPASGTGSVVTAGTAGDNVWQGLTPGVPEQYSIFNGYIYLDVPVESDEAGKKIKLKYLKTIDRFDDFSDTCAIPFYDAISKYVAYKIEVRRGNFEIAAGYKKQFEEIVAINMDAYKIPTMEALEYYNFGFESTGTTNNNTE